MNLADSGKRLCHKRTRHPTKKKEKAREELKNAEGTILEVDLYNTFVSDAVKLSKVLHNVTVFQKGGFDIATDGKKTNVVKEQGALKKERGTRGCLEWFDGSIYLFGTRFIAKGRRNLTARNGF